MGGSKPGKILSDAAKGTINTATFGTYDPNTGSIGTGQAGEAVANNLGLGTTGAMIAGAAQSIMPTAPEMHKAESAADQANRAAAEAAAKLEAELGKKASGLSSTILGGSIGTDNALLRKKKLLGE